MIDLQKLIADGNTCLKNDVWNPSGDVIAPSRVKGERYAKWKADVRAFTDKLPDSSNKSRLTEIIDKSSPTNVREVIGILTSILENQADTDNNSLLPQMNSKSFNKVFIVHGHDEAAKDELARTLDKGGFEAIILHEQPNSGSTIIEKIEKYTDVGYAVVLYTECDFGRDKDSKVEDEKYRARQNVVFEHGYLIAKLGRNRVSALVKGNVETPGDISGVVYIPMDSNGAWKTALGRDMNAAGLPVDLNTLCF